MDEEGLIAELSKEELIRVFAEAIAAAKTLHDKLSSATQDAGFTVEVLPELQRRYTVLYDKAEEDPSIYPFVVSGWEVARGLGIELNYLAGLVNDISTPLSYITNSTGTFGGTTDSAWAISGLKADAEFKPFPVPPTRKSTQDYSAHLKVMDPALSAAYDQVWQIYYSTTADRYRSCLYMMRQVFDHFFSHLAPDELVRKSEYWVRKQGSKDPDQIYRPERISYAAHTHIKASDRADTLAASAKQINALYDYANVAHKRGALDEDKAYQTLLAMDRTLKDWIDALP